jgi:hypothetical protein
MFVSYFAIGQIAEASGPRAVGSLSPVRLRPALKKLPADLRRDSRDLGDGTLARGLRGKGLHRWTVTAQPVRMLCGGIKV